MTVRDAAWYSEYPEFGRLFGWHSVDGTIMINDTIALGADGQITAWAIALLRECASWGLPVCWDLTTHPPFETSALHHLPPPQSLDGQSPALRRWHESHRHGLYHFRQGPGFIQVKDARDSLRSTRLLLSDAHTVGVFRRCLRPVRLTELSEADRAEAELLTADRLLLQADELVVTLPARMRRWPVPVDAV
jgi:uncharacterized protein DUF5825